MANIDLEQQEVGIRSLDPEYKARVELTVLEDVRLEHVTKFSWSAAR